MFREKLKKNPDERGYLYIRESQYKRDKRTLKRKPHKMCDGTATKQRGKYSKKKDIYCGKIYEIELKHFETFREYIEKKTKDYINYITTLLFDELIDEYINYILYIYEIEKEDFFDKNKKKVYTIANGYISQEIILWLKRFNIKGNTDSTKEYIRFLYRCHDCGIEDEDIISSLYIKLMPDKEVMQAIKDEIEDIKKINPEKREFDNLMGFLKRG